MPVSCRRRIVEVLPMDLSQTPGTLDDDEVAVPCRRSWLQTRSVSGDGGDRQRG